MHPRIHVRQSAKERTVDAMVKSARLPKSEVVSWKDAPDVADILKAAGQDWVPDLNRGIKVETANEGTTIAHWGDTPWLNDDNTISIQRTHRDP